MSAAVAVTVVVPALNEEESLPHVLPLIPTWVHEIILVDGHSQDNTVTVAQQVLPSVRVIRQEGKGKGAALRTGVQVASGDIIVMLDADGSTDPREIPSFVAALLLGADFAKGSRFLQGAGTSDMPFYRQVGNWALTTLTNICFRTRYSDITYGYNAIWRCHSEHLALEIDNWAHEIVSSIRLAARGMHVIEVASYEHRRVAGIAKLSTILAGWMILTSILRERLGSYTTPVSMPPIDSAVHERESATSPGTGASYHTALAHDPDASDSRKADTETRPKERSVGESLQ
jgi:glycosyltransferase involved in cell wall biosynthesis